jgi:hypothetical protein
MAARFDFILGAALALLVSCFGGKNDGNLDLVIHGTIVGAPPASGTKLAVCVHATMREDFVGGESYEATYCGEGTTNELGQFTAGVVIPPHWQSVSQSTACVGNTCWSGGVPALALRDNEAMGGQVADIAITYE